MGDFIPLKEIHLEFKLIFASQKPCSWYSLVVYNPQLFFNSTVRFSAWHNYCIDICIYKGNKRLAAILLKKQIISVEPFFGMYINTTSVHTLNVSIAFTYHDLIYSNRVWYEGFTISFKLNIYC